MIVDDNETNSKILQEMLSSWQMSPSVATSTAAAQTLFNEAEAAQAPFRLIVIDSDMPEPDGFALADWIKDQNRPESNVIMMLTSLRTRSQVDLKGMGIKAVLTKPVRPSDLLDAITHALDFKAALTEEMAPPADQAHLPEGRHIKILVAEDTPFNQKFIARLLDRWGHQAVIVENGRKAIEVLTREKFDLVLMDVQMPEMDGFEATAAIRIREAETGEHVPIIAMTAHAMKGDRERCIEVGMDDYVPKPISANALFAAIKNLVPDEDPAAEPPKPVEGSLPANPGNEPIIDRVSLLKAFDDDWDFFTEVVEMFVQDYPQMMIEIESALQNRNAPTLMRSGHALKGMLGNFKAATGMQLAYELEDMGRREVFDGADAIFHKLSEELVKLKSTFLKIVQEESP